MNYFCNKTKRKVFLLFLICFSSMVLISNSNVDIESESKATTNLDNDYDSNNATPKDSAILNGGTIKYRQVIEAEVKHYEYIY